MRRESRFRTWTRGLILVEASIAGRRRDVPMNLVFDTGASITLVTPEAADRLGYSARDGDRVTTVSSAIGKEQGFTLRIDRLMALGFAVSDFPIHVFDLVESQDIDGLLGIDFLRRFNFQVRSAERRILAEQIAM
jgi:clan AA aspartic protease (TIGR02281 family)